MVLPLFSRRSSRLERDGNLVAPFERAPSRSAAQETNDAAIAVIDEQRLSYESASTYQAKTGGAEGGVQAHS